MAYQDYLDDGRNLLLKLALSFARAFVAALVVLIPGVLAAPDLEAGKALAVAAVVGAVTAGFRALQAAIASL